MRAVHRLTRAGALACLMLGAFVGGYAVLSVVLGLVPLKGHGAVAADGVEVFVVTNGVHAGFALPMRNPVADLSADFPPPPAARGERDVFVVVGWGDRLVYTETPTWRDLKPMSALSALIGLNPTVVHIEHIRRPPASPRVVPVRLSEAAYRRLVDHIRASLGRDAQGRTLRLVGLSHGREDAFYEGRGRYTLIYTCNEWVRDGLAKAGVTTARWAPFDWAIFRHLRS